MTWGLVIASRAKRQTRHLSATELDHINGAFSELSRDPLAGDVKLLRGTRGVFRRRVGDWRILFELDRVRKLILIIAIKRRGSNTY